MQRILDFCISATALAFLSPVFLSIALILRLTGEREVFFRQKRIGRYGKEINILKFATMLKDSPNLGAGTVTLKDDPRVLPIGKFLRKTKLNELPQLMNILVGDMSLIGPRPQTKRCFDAFDGMHQLSIMEVRPGLSGVGSIFFRNEEDMLDNHVNSDHFYDSVIMKYKGELEEWYVRNNNIFMYFFLIISTIIVVLTNKNVLKYYSLSNFPKPPEALVKFL